MAHDVEQQKVAREQNSDQLVLLLVCILVRIVGIRLDGGLEHRVDHEELEDDEKKREENHHPLEAASVELAQSVDEDDVDLLEGALLAGVLGVVIESLLFFFLG